VTDTPDATPKPSPTQKTDASPTTLPDRILADIGDPGGPLLLVTVLIHGNEPGGRDACQQVIDRLNSPGAPALAGRVVVMIGNLRASVEGVRRLDHDLNRVFPPGPASESPPAGKTPPHEHAERDEIIALIKRLKSEHDGCPLWFLDLHTTSSQSMPYLSLPSDDGGTLTFAAGFPIHRVSGFSSIVHGTIDRYLYDQGFIGFVCEGGQHQRHSSVTNMAAMLWLMIEETSILPPPVNREKHPEVVEAHALLEAFILHLPAHFRVVHRHRVEPEDAFRMEPGFANFSKVRAGQTVAHDRRGPILCPQAGNLLLPLYQPTGSDGFFLVAEQTAD